MVIQRNLFGRNESRQHGTKADVPDTQMQQGQQDADGLLLVPAEDHAQRCLGQSQHNGVLECLPDKLGIVGLPRFINLNIPL